MSIDAMKSIFPALIILILASTLLALLSSKRGIALFRQTFYGDKKLSDDGVLPTTATESPTPDQATGQNGVDNSGINAWQIALITGGSLVAIFLAIRLFRNRSENDEKGNAVSLIEKLEAWAFTLEERQSAETMGEDDEELLLAELRRPRAEMGYLERLAPKSQFDKKVDFLMSNLGQQATFYEGDEWIKRTIQKAKAGFEAKFGQSYEDARRQRR